jgi:hypothetical protein
MADRFNRARAVMGIPGSESRERGRRGDNDGGTVATVTARPGDIQRTRDDRAVLASGFTSTPLVPSATRVRRVGIGSTVPSGDGLTRRADIVP